MNIYLFKKIDSLKKKIERISSDKFKIYIIKQILYIFWIPYKNCSKIFLFFIKKFQLLILQSQSEKYAIYLNPFGRFGNNIQQLLIAIIIRELFDIKIFLSKDFELVFSSLGFNINKINYLLNKNEKKEKIIQIKKVFFFYNEVPSIFNKSFTRSRINSSPFLILRNDTFINDKLLFKNLDNSKNKLYSIFSEVIKSNFTKNIYSSSRYNELCFLHLRAGDINNHKLDHFVTNPLSYYLWLRKYFKNIIVVTEPGKDHILLSEILKIFDVIELKRSNEFIEDFSCLANCQNLATSGVSTFPIAASIFNKNLKNFYSSNIYLREHLNPTFLSLNVKKYEYQCNEYWEKWFNINPEKRKNLIFES